MILKAKTLSWYHDEKEYQQGKRPLGVIYMQAIYHCVPAKTLKPTDDLNVNYQVHHYIDWNMCMDEKRC